LEQSACCMAQAPSAAGNESATAGLLGAAFVGGAVAGFSEHLVMYPVDTVKTRLQVSGQPGMPVYTSLSHAGKSIIKQEGFRRLYRGLPAVLVGAIPSHAAYFTALEGARMILSSAFDNNDGRNRPLVNAFAGACGTLAHDLIVTPLDVVKQRLVGLFVLCVVGSDDFQISKLQGLLINPLGNC
jgi:solute carrier family 25 iron transporter 28/37